MKSLNYNELDPGIRKTVRWLNSHAFPTSDSGDGVSKFDKDGNPTQEGALKFPHVVILSKSHRLVDDADDLYDLLENFGFDLETGKIQIEATYSPVDGHATIFISGLDDTLLTEVLSKHGERDGLG